MTAVRSIAWLAFLFATACTSTPPSIKLHDVDGAVHQPQHTAGNTVHVIIVTSHECPIANAYAPTIGELHQHWQDQPVRLFLAQIGTELTPAAAKSHQQDYALPGTVLLDPEQRLARALGVTRTPEAVVLRDSEIVYRGRIDDEWRALGDRGNSARSHDLRNAVAAALAGETVPQPYPPAVGCLLPTPQD